MLWYHLIWVLTYVSVMSVNRMESFKHWNGKMVMVTTLRLLASALIVIIEIRCAAGSRGWSRSFSFIKQWQYQWKFVTLFCSMPFFKVHIYLCLQSLIPYSSPLIICYPVDANLHMYSIIAVYAPPFRVASMPAVRYDLTADRIWRSPSVPMLWLTIYQDYMVTCTFEKFMLTWYDTCLDLCWINYVWVWVWVWVRVSVLPDHK